MVALLDVGGTLWPESWPRLDGDRERQIRRLCAQVQGLTDLRATGLVEILSGVTHPPGLRQVTDQLVRDALRRCGVTTGVAVESVIGAMCLPAAGRVELLPGARRLLRELSAQARIVVVSNTMWRRREALHSDFAQLGVAHYVSDYVTSLDVGWRKPDPRIFEAALGAGGSPPEQCLLIGDSEANDIEPAVSRGMVAIRVAVEALPTGSSAAHHVCASLDEVTDLLRRGPVLWRT